MRSIHDVLREREVQAERLRDEIDKLREAIRILEEAEASPAPPAATGPVPLPANRWP